MTQAQLERIELLSAQLNEAINIFKASLDRQEIFEVRKKILLQIRQIERELEQTKMQDTNS